MKTITFTDAEISVIYTAVTLLLEDIEELRPLGVLVDDESEQCRSVLSRLEDSEVAF
jgi:hypothetical protein